MRCPDIDCTNDVDPRFSAHDGHGGVVGICDGHGICEGTSAETCTCPVIEPPRADKSAWHEAQQRRSHQ